MRLRILHVLDHSIPLHSGYSFRTLSILREQHKLGWETVQLTTPKQGPSDCLQDDIDGVKFYRTPSLPGVGLLAQMRLTADRLREVVRLTQPHVIHAHSQGVSGYRLCMRCAPPGRTPPWTMERRCRVVRGTAYPERWKVLRYVMRTRLRRFVTDFVRILPYAAYGRSESL